MEKTSMSSFQQGERQLSYEVGVFSPASTRYVKKLNILENKSYETYRQRGNRERGYTRHLIYL